MPICSVSYSSDVDVNQISQAVHAGVLKSGLFNSDGSDIKVVGLPYTFSWVGGNAAPFVHVKIEILSGRSDLDKAMLSELVAKQLKSIGAHDFEVTIQIVEIHKGSYVKLPAA